MKKTLLVSAIALGLLTFTGCNQQPKKPEVDTEQCMMDGAKAPAWICNEVEGLTAIGSAPKNPLGFSNQLTEAMADARDRLARTIQVKVKNMFKKTEKVIKTSQGDIAEKVTQNVSNQLTKMTLNGSKRLKMWTSPNGTLFVLVGIKNPEEFKAKAKQVVKNAIKTTYKNDEALWEEFKAKKAQEELEKAIDKEF